MLDYVFNASALKPATIVRTECKYHELSVDISTKIIKV